MALPIAIPIAIAAGTALGNYFESKNKTDSIADLYDDLQTMGEETTQANQGDIDAYKQFIENQFGGSPEAYRQAVSDYLNSETYQNGGFDFNGDIKDYYDPAANQRVAAAMTAINNSAASGGNRFSSDYISRVGARQQALASDEWKAAYDRLMQDRSRQLQEYQANSDNSWKNYDAQQQKLKAGLDIANNDRSLYYQGMSDVLGANIGNRTANLQSQANAMGGQAQAYADQPGFFSSLMGPAASFMGSYFGKG